MFYIYFPLGRVYNGEMKNTESYIVVSGVGEDDCYEVHSAWSSKEAADRFAIRLNNSDLYKHYQVEVVPLDVEVPEGYTLGVRAVYDHRKYGFVVEKENILFTEVLHKDNKDKMVFGHHYLSWQVDAQTEDECIEQLIAFADSGEYSQS